MKLLTGLDVHRLLKSTELVGLRLGKISRSENIFVFEVTGPKKYLIIRPGGFYLANYAPRGKADGFSMFLRKRLKGRIIKDIKQYGVDRVIKMDFDTCSLIFELFGKLNIILIEEEKVAGQLRRSPKFTRGSEYIPPSSVNYLEMTKSDFSKLIEDKTKSEVARLLGVGKKVEELWGKDIQTELIKLANTSLNPEGVESDFKKEDSERLIQKELKICNAEKTKFEKTIKETKKLIEKNEKKAATYRDAASKILLNLSLVDEKLRIALQKGKKRIKVTLNE